MIDYENMSREDILQKAYETAFQYEKELGNCPQAIMATMHDLFDIGGDSAFKSGTGLAGGGALAGTGTCGALIGGYMVLGMVFGRDQKAYMSGKRAGRAYKATKKLHDRFVTEFGGATCAEVQKSIFGRSFNLWSREEYKTFEEMGGHEDKCPDVVGKVAQWTADIILDELKK
ncbi:MAG: C-GCAxxG-C-C family protein [Candidatus Methanofastidiosia archaeon]|jgi:C_GCAxxG_C_C family probable redox protein